MSSLPRWSLLWLLVGAAPAAAQTTLAWKLAPGDTFVMERGTTQDQ